MSTSLIRCSWCVPDLERRELPTKWRYCRTVAAYAVQAFEQIRWWRLACSWASLYCCIRLPQHGNCKLLLDQIEPRIPRQFTSEASQSHEIWSPRKVSYIIKIHLNIPQLLFLFRYSDALDILDSIIKKDETNAAPRKRKVTIYKSQGMIIEAIKELTDYLKVYVNDTFIPIMIT